MLETAGLRAAPVRGPVGQVGSLARERHRRFHSVRLPVARAVRGAARQGSQRVNIFDDEKRPMHLDAVPYGGHGYLIFPCERGGVRPRTALRAATADTNVIVCWWRRWPNANI